MNLDALGNVGDFLGGIGVVVTLVYLAAQIRQNTAQLRANAEGMRTAALDETQRSMNHWREAIVHRKDVAELWERGLSSAGDQLDSADHIRFGLLLGELIYAWQAVYRRAVNAEDMDHWKSNYLYVRGVLNRPAPREFWQRTKAAYFPDFVEEIERILSEAPDA